MALVEGVHASKESRASILSCTLVAAAVLVLGAIAFLLAGDIVVAHSGWSIGVNILGSA